MFSTRKTFIEKLRDKLNNPAIKAKIRQNSGARIFDGLPEEFDTIFSDTAVDAAELGRILKDIPANHIEMGEGHVFRFKTDAAKIERWSKRIIARISRELLTDDNSIKQEFLNLVNKSKDTLTARDLICGYFAAATQYITALVNKSDDANYIDINVFQAFIEFNNAYPRWVTGVFLDRGADPNVNYNERDNRISAEDSNFDIKMGIIGGVVGTLFVVGLGGGVAAYQAYKSRQNKPANDLPDTDTKEAPRSPLQDWYLF